MVKLEIVSDFGSGVDKKVTGAVRDDDGDLIVFYEDGDETTYEDAEITGVAPDGKEIPRL